MRDSAATGLDGEQSFQHAVLHTLAVLLSAWLLLLLLLHTACSSSQQRLRFQAVPRRLMATMRTGSTSMSKRCMLNYLRYMITWKRCTTAKLHKYYLDNRQCELSGSRALPKDFPEHFSPGSREPLLSPKLNNTNSS
jgi:hypothetical protein